MATTYQEGDYLHFWCPGCDGYHTIRISGPYAWEWNGLTERPTIRPSILVTGSYWNQETQDYDKEICHSFITNGQIQFLTDCTHPLAGQTVTLPIPRYEP